MRRSLILLLATMTTFAPAISARAHTSDATGGSSLEHVRLPAGVIVASGSGDTLDISAPGARIEDALRSAIDPTDVRTQMDAVRLLIEAESGLHLPDLRPAHTRDHGDAFHVLPPQTRSETMDEPPAPDPEPEPAGTMSFPSPAGDLSGDGLDDVLSYDYTLPQGTLEIRALRGTDGAQLWKRKLTDTDDATAMPGSDLTGDGIDDLILLGLDVEAETYSVDCPDEEPYDHCGFDYAAEYTWLAGVLSGANGKVEWSRTYPASQTYHFLFESQDDVATGHYRIEESLASTNIGLWPYLSGDHDGDGLDDLVLESIDLDYAIEGESNRTVIVYEDTGGFNVESATRAAVLRGTDGQIVYTRSSERGPTIASLEPVGDIVGSPAPDLLWENAIYTDDTYSCLSVPAVRHCTDGPDTTVRFSIEAIDGATLGSVWKKAIDGVHDTFVFSLDADVSGDGTDDIAQLTVDWNGPTFTTSVVSGRDGSDVWTRRSGEDLEFPIVVGDLGGSPGNDLVLGSFLESYDTLTGDDAFSIRLTRAEGRTGQTIFETTRPIWTAPGTADGIGIYLYIGGMGDADGDHEGDLYAGGIGEILEPDDSGWWVPSDVDSTAFIESSRQNAVLLQRNTEDPMTFEGVPDLDGDGRADVFEWHYPLDPFADDPRFDLVVERAAPDATLWGRSFVGDEFWLGTLWPGGDHDGKPGEELVYGDNSENAGHWISRVGSLDGASGTARWIVQT